MKNGIKDPIARFYSYGVLASTGCIEWTGAKNPFGYGFYNYCGNKKLAHRLSWELQRGPIPSKICVLHRCDNPKCFNVDHLFLGTLQDNVADREAKGRTASGDRSGARTKPERHCRGDNHPSRLHPESVKKGSQAANAKLTEADVAEIRRRRANGEQAKTNRT